jgi:hypothetical protein
MNTGVRIQDLRDSPDLVVRSGTFYLSVQEKSISNMLPQAGMRHERKSKKDTLNSTS